MRSAFLTAVVMALLGRAAQGQGGEAGRPRLVAQLGHADLVMSVAFSPDGRYVLTGSYDQTARIWEAASGKEIRRLVGHAGPVPSVAFSPDGRSVLTGSYDGTARIWDVASGNEIRRFVGHADAVLSATFSPDGRSVLTGSSDATVRIWDAACGKEIRRFEGHAGPVPSVAFSPDGRSALTGSSDRTARLWDASSGKEIRRFEGHTNEVWSAASSRDGRFVLTGSADHTARLWDASSGKEIRRFEGHTDRVEPVAFSPDGRSVLTGSSDRTARLWDASSGKEVRRFEGHTGTVTSVAFSPDRLSVLTGSGDATARLWDASSGKEVRRFAGYVNGVSAAAFSQDGRSVLTGSWDSTARLWDASSGKEVRRFVGHTAEVVSAAFSPDGRSVLTGSGDGTARLWDASSGQETRRFKGHTQSVLSAALSADGRSVLTGSWDSTARLWDASSGKEVRRFEGHASAVSSVAFSPDGRSVLTGSYDGTARLWDASSGKEVRRFEGHTITVLSAAFSPDGRRVLTGSEDGIARLWDASSGKEVRRFEGHTDAVTSAAFSLDGRRVLTGGADGIARLWDASSGNEIRRFEGHAGLVRSVAFSSDGGHALTVNGDGTTLWDTSTGAEVCRLISFRDGSWAVVDPDGRYDASNGGDVEGLYWVVGMEPISLDQLKERYYDPGLLAKHLGLNKEPLREVMAFTAPKLYPSATLEEKEGKIVVHLEDRGGGIGRVVVSVNGVERTADARDPAADPNAKELTLALDLAGDPRLRPGEPNKVEVFAFNAEGYLRSRGLEREWAPSGEAGKRTPELWAVVAGISDYRGDAIDLRYAAKDARDFVTALSLAGGRLFGGEQLHVAHVEAPTRAAVVAALEAARQASPGDVLVVYLAGHGVNFGGPDGDYYFLCADAASADLKDPAVREAVALSSAELTACLNAIPALKRVLVLDTCASGRLVEKLSEARDIPSSQVRAMERLKDRTGFYVISGCASDSVSYEASRYGQGLLTYSLLLGMRGAALREEEYVDVSKLFGFAADRVPEFAKGVGGIQRPVVAAPKGGASFDLGRLTAEDKAKVPLQMVRPMVLRANFQDEKRPRDTLGLAKLVDERHRDASSRGGDAPLVFIDAGEFPDACEIGGRYRVEDGKVTVEVTVFRGEEEIGRFAAEGSADDLAALAARIADEALQHLK